MRRSCGLFFYLFLSTVAFVGCGNGSAREATDPAGSPAEAVAVVEVSDGSGTGASAGSIETASHANAGVSVDLLEVSRTGADALTVRWQYRTTALDETMLGESESEDPYSLTREAYLVDDRKLKKYLVLMDASDRPVASALDENHDEGSPLILAPGEPLTAWATGRGAVRGRADRPLEPPSTCTDMRVASDAS